MLGMVAPGGLALSRWGVTGPGSSCLTAAAAKVYSERPPPEADTSGTLCASLSDWAVGPWKAEFESHMPPHLGPWVW